MTETQVFTSRIKALVAKSDLKEALRQLRLLLENSPALDEVLHQSARLQGIRKQIRMGEMDEEQASLLHNRISAGILELLRELEAPQGFQLPVQAEVERAAGVVNHKNVVMDSTIEAGGNVHIGDKKEEHHHHYGDRKIPHALTPPPFLPEVFLGREDDLRRIHDRLFAPGGNLLLLVNGEGGVGKTSVASKYFHEHRHKYAHVAWVLSEKSIANALLLLAFPLGLQFSEQMNTTERLETLLAALANLKKPCLLVLDNANELPDLETNYLRLRQCSNFHLLLTTRITNFERAEICRIEGLPEDEALALFEKHYRPLSPEARALFAQIREAVAGNTLVVELLAKNLAILNRLRDRYTLTDLLADLQQKGLLQLAQSQEVRTGYQSKAGALRREKPEAIIAAMYDLGELPPEERALLSVFAVLPAESIAFEMLETLLRSMENLDVHLISLSQKGWLAEQSAAEQSGRDLESRPDTPPAIYFKISPVVQEIVRRKNPNLRADCQVLVDVLNEKLDYQAGVGHLLNATYEDALHFARYAEAVFFNLPEPDTDLSILTNCIGSFHQTTGNLDKAFYHYEAGIRVNKALCALAPDNPNYKNGLASSYSQLGDTQRTLGNLEEALTFFEKDIELTKELYEAYPQNVSFKNGLAISYYRLGQLFEEQKNLPKAFEYFELDLKFTELTFESSPRNVEYRKNLRISYDNMGEISEKLGKKELSEAYFEKARSLE